MDAFVPNGDCCDRPLAKAIASGVLETATVWTCPECGIDWRVRIEGPVRQWIPQVVVRIAR